MNRYEENCIGYELGNFLPPKYKGSEKCEMFFLLLQNPNPDKESEDFLVKLGKTRFLDGGFKSDCLKALVYLALGEGQLAIYDLKLSTRKNGTKYFDAVFFLEPLGIEYSMCDTWHYRYFKSRLHKREVKKEIVLKEDNKVVQIIDRRINADDYERIRTYYII